MEHVFCDCHGVGGAPQVLTHAVCVFVRAEIRLTSSDEDVDIHDVTGRRVTGGALASMIGTALVLPQTVTLAVRGRQACSASLGFSQGQNG